MNGRLSPMAFYAIGKVEDWDKVLTELPRFRFECLDPASGKVQAFGWVRLNDPFTSEFSKSDIFFGESTVGLTLRVDTISVPASQLKLYTAHRVREVMKETGKAELSKREIARVREDVLAELQRKSLPVIKLYEMIYQTSTGRIWFFGKSKGVVQTFQELFHETFGVLMVLDSPFIVARAVLGEEEADKLVELRETTFVSDAEAGGEQP